jgi:cytochrome c
MKIKKLIFGFVFISLLSFLLFIYTGCSTGDAESGVGPVKDVQLNGMIDPALVTKGEKIFKEKCQSCHMIEKRHIGPAIKDVTKRRKPEWIMNMILNPEQMTKVNPIAKELFKEYMIQMVFQNVSHDDARAILEYFREIDSLE